MIRKPLYIAAMLGFSLALSGCPGSPAWNSFSYWSDSSEAKQNNKNMQRLRIGQSKADVLKIMGPPVRREAYQLDQRNFEIGFYRTIAEVGIQNSDSFFTPVAYENGWLAGWGRNYYNQVVRSAVELTIKRR